LVDTDTVDGVNDEFGVGILIGDDDPVKEDEPLDIPEYVEVAGG
jgi:hypothetical protein